MTNLNNLTLLAVTNKISLTEIKFPSEEAINFITSLFTNEPDPIFEQNWVHILSYLRFGSTIYSVSNPEGQGLLVANDEEIYLIGINFKDPKFISSVKSFVSGLGINKFKIKYVSLAWIKNYEDLLKNTFPNVAILPRSKEEAIYDLDLLATLSGKSFSQLRQTRNRLLNAGKIEFEELKRSNLTQGYNLLEQWNQVQGYKYTKDKLDKEKFALEKIVSFSESGHKLYPIIGKINSIIVSLCMFFIYPRFPQYGVIYLLKGINRSEDGGVRGASDATYLHVFSQLQFLGAKFVNDGELGSEPGTRQHKLMFQPIRFLQSFDIELSL